MVNVTRANMLKAAAGAKHVRVRCLDLSERVFLVGSASHPGSNYLVRLQITRAGVRQGSCDCMAGMNNMACKHLAACVGFLRGVQRMRAQSPGGSSNAAADGGARAARVSVRGGPAAALKMAPASPREIAPAADAA